MRNRTLLLVLVTVFPLFAAAQTASEPITVTFNPGLELSYQSIASLVGTEKTTNALTVLSSRVAVKMDILEYLSMEVLAGYHFAFARDPLDFTELPLSLRWERQKFSGLLLGAALISEPLSFDDFSVHVRGEFTLAMEKNRTWEIELPQVSGQATGDNAFSLLTLDVTMQYQGLTGVTLFLGPRLNLLHGKFSAAESIADLEGKQEFSYRQKNLVGAMAGLTVEIGDNWELTLKASLLARTEACLAVYYVF
ncbi:MAG TPA: hypothetical protein VLQ89_03555 [Candidatus Binatia bacterium]|nr:hypothetical protein [Candidatus Binatia bacterium]